MGRSLPAPVAVTYEAQTVVMGARTRRTGPPPPRRRLYDAIDQRAFSALTHSPGARTVYDQQRVAGGLYRQALCALGNRLARRLHRKQPYNERASLGTLHGPACRPGMSN